MKKITSIFTVSLVAILVAGAANADISSKAYVDTVVKSLATTAALNQVKATADSAVQPGDLATVATTGSYNNLTDKPTIPAAITVDFALSATSTNPVQNKVINTALAGKQASLTTAQLAAANSGITAAKITTYDGYAATIASNTAAAAAAQSAADDAQAAADAAQTAANSKVVANAAITAGTGTKITYDTKGLVTGSAALTATDIPTIPSGKVSGLATVATSGSYDDLSDKPTIPAAITVDTALSGTSTNPVQNKVVSAALDGKLSTTGTAAKATADASGNNIVSTYATKSAIADMETKTNAAATYATKAQINALDSTSTGTGAVVTAVSQTDGKVAVTKGNVQIPVGSATGTTYATIWVE